MPASIAQGLASLTEEDLFLATLYGEVRGEPHEGIVAVACSIRNRVLQGRFGKGYGGVLKRYAQYSCLWPKLGGINHEKVLRFAARLPELRPGEEQLREVVRGVMSGDIEDTTGGATHYHTDYIETPFWAKPPARITCKKGVHIFYAGVR